jgi:hypothetical protein
MWRTLLALGLAAALAAPAGANEKEKVIPAEMKVILEKAPSLELLSVNPERPKEKPTENVAGYAIFGKTEIKDEKMRKEILDALDKSVADGGPGARCFIPRHALRGTYDGKTVELVICFECAWVYTYVNGERTKTTLTTTKSPESVLDKILKEANVPLAPKGK